MTGGRTSFNFEAAPDLPGSDQLSKYGFGAIRALARRLWKFEINGIDNVPLDGPALICPNHLSFCDSVFVPAALPRRVWAIGKGEYMDDWKTKHLFPALGMIPVDRSGGTAAQAALDAAAGVLDGGHLFMIYPEGTRSRSGDLHKGRTGAARLAIRCDAPIIPVGHEGTLAVQPPDQFTMKPFLPVRVNIGEPMWAHDHGDPDDPRTLRTFTDALMFEIAKLSGQRYRHTYAGKREEARDDSATRPLPPKQDQTTTPTPPPGRGRTERRVDLTTNGSASRSDTVTVPDQPAPTVPSRPTRPTRPTRPG